MPPATPKKLSESERRRIRITEAEIAKAKPKQSGKCLVARAIAAKYPDASRVDIDQQTIRFTRDGQRWVYLTPWAVQRYIIQFDAGDPIDPFEFSLTNSVQIQRAIRTEAGTKVQRARNTRDQSKKKLEQAQQALLPPPDPGKRAPRPTPEARDVLARLDEAAKASEDEFRAVVAEVKAAGVPLTTQSDPELPRRAAMSSRAVNRSRTSRRHYGGREMRLNQERAERRSSAIEAEAGYDLQPMPRGGYPE